MNAYSLPPSPVFRGTGRTPDWFMLMTEIYLKPDGRSNIFQTIYSADYIKLSPLSPS